MYWVFNKQSVCVTYLHSFSVWIILTAWLLLLHFHCVISLWNSLLFCPSLLLLPSFRRDRVYSCWVRMSPKIHTTFENQLNNCMAYWTEVDPNHSSGALSCTTTIRTTVVSHHVSPYLYNFEGLIREKIN